MSTSEIPCQPEEKSNISEDEEAFEEWFRGSHSTIGKQFTAWLLEDVRAKGPSRGLTLQDIQTEVPTVFVKVLVNHISSVDVVTGEVDCDFSIHLDWFDPSVVGEGRKVKRLSTDYFNPVYRIENLIDAKAEPLPGPGNQNGRLPGHITNVTRYKTKIFSLCECEEFPFDKQTLKIVIKVMPILWGENTIKVKLIDEYNSRIQFSNTCATFSKIQTVRKNLDRAVDHVARTPTSKHRGRDVFNHDEDLKQRLLPRADSAAHLESKSDEPRVKPEHDDQVECNMLAWLTIHHNRNTDRESYHPNANPNPDAEWLRIRGGMQSPRREDPYHTTAPDCDRLHEWDLQCIYGKLEKLGDDEVFSLNIIIEREPMASFWSLIAPAAGTGLISFASYSISVRSIDSRSSLMVTLVLTMVATRFVLVQKIPAVAYLTTLDKYTLFILLMFVEMVVFQTVAFELVDTSHSQLGRMFDMATAGFTVVQFVVVNLWLWSKLRKALLEMPSKVSESPVFALKNFIKQHPELPAPQLFGPMTETQRKGVEKKWRQRYRLVIKAWKDEHKSVWDWFQCVPLINQMCNTMSEDRSGPHSEKIIEEAPDFDSKSSQELTLCVLNIGNANSEREFISGLNLGISLAMAEHLATMFRKPFLHFFFVGELLELLKQSKASGKAQCSSWVQHVQGLDEFFEYANRYLRAANKQPVDRGEMSMAHVMEAFLQEGTFDDLMSTSKSQKLEDMRVLSVPDRIPNRHTLLHNPSIRSDDPSFVNAWFASINKDEKDFLDNVGKYLVPTERGLAELSKNDSKEARTVAYTVMFYLLFVSDFSFSAFSGSELPRSETDQKREEHQKVKSFSTLLELRPLSVIFVQEPLDNMQALLDGVIGANEFEVYAEQQLQRFAGIIVCKQDRLNIRKIEQDELKGEIDFETFDGILPVIHTSKTEHVAFISVHAKVNPGLLGVQQDLFHLNQRIREIDSEITKVYVGIDANVDLLPHDSDQPYVPTNLKMRSFLQMQLCKAHYKDKGRKDFILLFPDGSNCFQIIPCEVGVLTEDNGLTSITEVESTWRVIPTPSHPYDHYLLTAKVLI